jgi:anaerobic selenocysteine-containing dehydrogenase
MVEEKTTYCRICEPMCGLKVRVEGSRVLSVRGDPDHPLSKGYVCRRGVAFGEIHNDPDRLRRPLRRSGNGFEEISWETALDETARRLGHIRDLHGPQSVAVYNGNPMAFCTYGTISVPMFVSALGTRQFFTAGSQDCNNKFAASERVFGSPLLQPIPDLDHVHYLLIVGANPAVSGMSVIQVPRPLEALQNIRKRGGELVVVDPRRTETAKLASEHLFIRPDTDCFFLLSLLWVLIEKGRVDIRWVEADPEGFARLKEVVAQWPPERTEPLTGISKEKVEEIALRLGGPRPAAVYGSIGINLGRSGTLNYWLLLAINLLAGHFDRKGGCLLSRGLVNVDKLYRRALRGHRERSRIGDFEPVLGTYPAAVMAPEILTERRTGIRALVVVAGNPLLSVPNEGHLKAALKKLDLLVCLDLYRNETGAFAHYLLPCTDFFEREDLNLSHATLQLRPYAALTRPVVEPDGEQRPEWRILEDLAERMGLKMWGGPVGHAIRLANRLPGWKGLLETSRDGDRVIMAKAMLRVLLRLMGQVDLKALESADAGIVLRPNVFGRLRPGKRRWGRGFEVRLAPPDLLREAWKLDAALELRQAGKGELLLIGKRERITHNTWLHNADGLIGGETTNYLYMHPQDAAAKGIEEGDAVRVRSLEGEHLEVPCRITSDMMPGVVALPHGWGHRYAAGWSRANARPGVNVNRLATDSVWKIEPIAGMSWLTGIPVQVSRLKPDKARNAKGERAKGKG